MPEETINLEKVQETPVRVPEAASSGSSRYNGRRPTRKTVKLTQEQNVQIWQQCGRNMQESKLPLEVRQIELDGHPCVVQVLHHATLTDGVISLEKQT